ncbi:MAG: hypothetical protein J6C98_09650 [Oscillospiraceae bacterium]|nr:hypothetical protein [Oscillospiraceae bacterium]
MNYGLPTKLEIRGTEWAIRYDFRCVLEICAAMEDPELDKQDKAFVAMTILYPDFPEIPAADYEEALKQCFRFIDGGEDHMGQKGPKLVSWEQDIRHIIAPVNRVLGQEVRSIPYDPDENTGGLHWWTFLSAYMEIGDCVFAQIVRIRNLLAKGKPLDKADREWYRQNRHLVDIRQTFSEVEDDLLKQWGAK